MTIETDDRSGKGGHPHANQRGCSPTVARILFVENNNDGTVGGSHRVLLEVVRHLDRRRFEPVVLFYQRHSLVGRFEEVSKVLFLSSRAVRLQECFPRFFLFLGRVPALKVVLLFLQRIINFLLFAGPQFLRMSRLLVRERIDLVCINNSPFQTDWLFACKLLNRKCVSYFRATPTDISKKHGRLFDLYDAILSISNAVTENARRQHASVRKFHLVYDGIDTGAVLASARKPKEVTRSEFLPAADWALIGVVNHLKHWKGQHVAVEAMRHLVEKRPKVLCLLVGDVGQLDAEYAASLQRRITEYGLESNVKLTGRRDDVPDIMTAFDIVLHTSLSNEGLPRVILEAMTLGRPVIATAAGPNPEMVIDGVTGFLVDAEDPVALAARIDFVLGDRTLREKLGRNAQTRAVELFGIDTNMKATERILGTVLGRQQGKMN